MTEFIDFIPTDHSTLKVSAGGLRISSAADDQVQVCICSDWSAMRKFERIADWEIDQVYGDLLPLLREGDFNLFNLEAPVTSRENPVRKGGPCLVSSPDAMGMISGVPFHLATLANNHAMDHGEQGLKDTLEALRSHQVEWIGAGLDLEQAEKPWRGEIKGIPLTVFNSSEGEDGYRAEPGVPGVYKLDVSTLQERIRAEKQAQRLVIVIHHGGKEHVPVPPPFVRQELSALACAGADLIVAHHPHAVQGVEMVGTTPVVYSLGNFLFWQDHPAFYQHTGMFLRCGLSRDRLTSLELVPYQIDPTGLSLLRGDRFHFFVESLRRATRILESDEKATQVWEAVMDEMGFQQLEIGIELWKTDPLKAAGKIYNSLVLPTHHHFLSDSYRRYRDGRHQTSPQWARDLVRQWLDTPYAGSSDPEAE